MERKVAVVTGASSGIGAALCKKLGADGWHVVLAARRRAELDKIAAQSGEHTLVVVTDVTRRLEVERLKNEALQQFGHIDVWVNNAGRGINRAVMELSETDFDEMMNVNVKSALYGIWTIVPYFKVLGKGHLINVSSFLGRLPLVGNRSAYNAAKAALNSLTANLRMDLRRTNPDIKVSLVMPGMVSTDFAKNALYENGSAPAPAISRAVIQAPQEVAEMLMDLIKNPRAELYTNPSSAETVKSYYADIAGFEDKLFMQ